MNNMKQHKLLIFVVLNHLEYRVRSEAKEEEKEEEEVQKVKEKDRGAA